jgi:hypothetical protein
MACGAPTPNSVTGEEAVVIVPETVVVVASIVWVLVVVGV